MAVPLELRNDILFEWVGMRREGKARNPLGLLSSFCNAPKNVALTTYGLNEKQRYESAHRSNDDRDLGVSHETVRQHSGPVSAPRTPGPTLLPTFIEALANAAPDHLMVHVRTLRAEVYPGRLLRLFYPNDVIRSHLDRWPELTSNILSLLTQFSLSNFEFCQWPHE